MFLVEMNFCKPNVIYGLDRNLSFFFVTFLTGAWSSKIALILLKVYQMKYLYIFINFVKYRIPVNRKLVQYKVFLDKIMSVPFIDH